MEGWFCINTAAFTLLADEGAAPLLPPLPVCGEKEVEADESGEGMKEEEEEGL